ncbi:regulator of nonsense transcripts 2 [Rhypophila decipiens]|uniref:Regulator of nonsense transcripts 2 n=1 Tax=Rhypophila decipiens TaxID=261697 RepID=A0AAN6XUW4_9PEZI|nr:regulator of nonsense transcripts 2 [Rhypophila decipiens]
MIASRTQLTLLTGELRDLNERAWNGEQDLFPVSASLDSTLKKNTAFIKRLRSAISPATLNTFLQEIRTVSLARYLSEIISACHEGLCKLKSPGEIEAGVEVISALHQRFGPTEFTEYLGWHLGKSMATPDRNALKALPADTREKEEKLRITRQRVLLRVVTELWLAGVLRTLDDISRPDDATKAVAGKGSELKPRGSTKGGGAEPFPLEVLKDLLGHDREHANLPLLVIFVKAFSWDILGVKSAGSEGRKTVEEDGATKTANGTEGSKESDSSAPEDAPFTSPELQERFRNILKRYYEDVKGHLVKDQKAIFTQSRKNAEAYVKSGEVFEDRQANFEKQVKAQERLVANAQVLADVLGAEMPDLKDNDDAALTANGSIGLVKAGEYLRGRGDGAGIWEDEEERRFYENLADLKGKVPGILLEEVKKKKADADEQVGRRIDTLDGETPKPADTTAAEQSMAIANKTIGAQVDTLLLRLPELTSKDVIDQTAIDFCFLNSKASRNRLIKALTDVPKGRSDLLPGWARLIATLGQYMPDIPKGVIEYLDSEFRSLQKRKEKEFLGQVRLGNIRYLAELTKFGIVPEHVLFHCLKVSLDDFSRMNIEIICDLLENCGRYLWRNPETSPRMCSFLETLQRKKSVQHIGQAERMLIENAVYYVDPPQRPAIQQKERTPMELFIRNLIYAELDKKNYNKVLKQIRRLHWEEKEVVSTLHKVFSKPGKLKYGNIYLLAILLSALYRYHSDFVIGVIDHVIESISLGLEQNDFKFSQRRIAEVKYLGELYNYRMLEHPVIFDTMYKIMAFGYGGAPIPGRVNPFDPPDDFFRIRLISTILECCGMFFNKGGAGKKLDYFLSFFQYYIYTKNPLPMDMEFVVQDIFALTRPQWKLASNLEEATKVFQLAMAQDQKNSGLDKAVEQEERASDESSDDDNADDALGDQDEDEVSGSEDADPEEIEPNQSSRDSESEDEAIVVTREEDDINPEEEADFEREYAKMMAESLESRKSERKQGFDIPIPVRTKARDAAAGNDAVDAGQESAPAGTMAFALLTKRGNRQQTRTLELPSDSHFAVAMKNQQEAKKEEHQRIKNLVLNYDLRENEDHDGEANHSSLKLNPNIHILSSAGHEKSTSHHHNRLDNRSAKERAGQRVRKLQLSDVDWYGNSPKTSSPDELVSVKPRHPPVRSGFRARGHKAKDRGCSVSSAVGRRVMSGNDPIYPLPGARKPTRLSDAVFT